MPCSTPWWRKTADNLRFCHAMSHKAELRTFASFMYQATSWNRRRKVVARLECSLQPVAGETGMRQEVDASGSASCVAGSGETRLPINRRSSRESLFELVALVLLLGATCHSLVTLDKRKQSLLALRIARYRNGVSQPSGAE
jgi:hypothetical protein